MKRIPIHIDGLIYEKQPHGGISRNFTNLINSLSEADAALPVLCLPAGCEWPRGMRRVSSRVVPGSIRLRPARVFGPLANLLTVRRRRRFWSSLDEGVFHSSYYSSPDGLQIPQVLSLQDTIYEDFPALFGSPRHMHHLLDKRLAVERSDAFIFSSEFGRSRAEVHYEIGGRPVLVCPYAVDPCLTAEPTPYDIDEFRSRVAGGSEFLLHVGSRSLHKNVARLLEAYSVWAGKKDVLLVLAGGGPTDSSEQAALEVPELRGRVIVIPSLNEHDLLLAYRAAQAFVFPSLSEGFGFPLVEALANGCPTAAARAGSLPEVGGDAPYYFDPQSADDIRAALDAVVQEHRGSQRWSTAQARARNLTWSQVAETYSEFYRQVADRHGQQLR